MDRAMVHSTTFKNNPMAMVAGLATLSVFDDERIVEHAAARATSGAYDSRTLRRVTSAAHLPNARG